MRMTVCMALCIATAGCSTTGGPGWTPADCAQDVELARLIAGRINRAIGESGHDAVSQADWDRYAAVGELLATAGCAYVPEEWSAP